MGDKERKLEVSRKQEQGQEVEGETEAMLTTDSWSTPSWLFDQLNRLYGPFDLDVAASSENAKCRLFFTEKTNGLSLPWVTREIDPGKAWMNCPYSNPSPWIEKALHETKYGVTTGALLPIDPSTKWYQKFISYERRAKIVEVFPWRIKFVPPKDWKGAVSGPRGSHMFVLFTPQIVRGGSQLEVPDAGNRNSVDETNPSGSFEAWEKALQK